MFRLWFGFVFQVIVISFHLFLIGPREAALVPKKAVQNYHYEVPIFVDEKIKISNSNGNWSYAEVDHWGDLYPTCGGSRQSPIVLDPKAVLSYTCESLNFTGYENERNAKIQNTGKSLMLTLEDDTADVPTISGGGLIGTYVFAQMHFHWGSNENQGSEHVLDTKRFAAEAHFVHYNLKYGSFDDALHYTDGVAVLGVLIREVRMPNPAYEPITLALEGVRDSGSEVLLKKQVTLASLLPENVSSFYRYYGSLTTPNCEEVVTWTVLGDSVSLGWSQMGKFRHLLDHDHLPLVDNYRPTQPLNGRIVYACL